MKKPICMHRRRVLCTCPIHWLIARRIIASAASRIGQRVRDQSGAGCQTSANVTVPDNFFCHHPRRFVGSYLVHFLSYHFETWQYCFCVYKECLCGFSTGENEYVVVFLFPCWRRYCPLLARTSGFTGGTTCPVTPYELCACLRSQNVGTPTVHISGGGRDVSELAEADFRFCYHVELFHILFACNGKGALHRSGCGIYASLLLTGLLRLFGTV